MHTLEIQPVYDRASQILKVLVVDDDVEDVAHLRRLLRRSGCNHQLLEANTIEQGLDELGQLPDVILLDYFIGENTGLDFLAKLSTNKHQPPVILLTGADDGDLDQCVFSGFVADYLPKKNIDPGMLVRSLHYAHRDSIRVRQLEYLAHYDPLTGLSNRRLFMDRLNHAFESVKRHKTTGALLYIDIDGFKQINDELGHDCGDELLKQVAERMSEVVRSADTVARLGGDEFVILLENISIAEAHCVAQKLLSTMEAPVGIRDRLIQSSLSIGLCSFSAESPSAHHILVNADRALYQAKLIGKHTYCSFNKRLVDSMAYQQQVESAAHEAVQNQVFELSYHLRTNAASGAVDAVVVEPVFPGQDASRNAEGVIALIGELGWAEQFSRLVFEKIWTDRERLVLSVGAVPLVFRIASNVTRLDVFCSWLLDQLRSRQLDPAGYCFEVCEEFLLKSGPDVFESLQTLQREGCAIVLVEFGDDLGALSLLQSAPLSAIQLSIDWVLKCAESARCAAVIAGVVNIAQSLGFDIQLIQNEGALTSIPFNIEENKVKIIRSGNPVKLDQLASELATMSPVSANRCA